MRWFYFLTVMLWGGFIPLAFGDVQAAESSTGSDPFDETETDFQKWIPVQMPDDDLRPSELEVRQMEQWVRASFAQETVPDERFAITVKRQDHGTFGVNRSCIGTTPLKIGDQTFKGLGTHANSELVVHFPKPIAKFTALLGIDNNQNTGGVRGSVQFSVESHGVELYRSETRTGHDAPLAMEIVFPEETREITLKTDTTGDGPSCDQADWCEPMATTATGEIFDLTEAITTQPILNVAIPFSFVYDGISSDELLPTWNFTIETDDQTTNPDSMNVANGKMDADEPDINVPTAGRTIYRWTDPKTGLSVCAIVRLFRQFSAADWVLTFENTGTQNTPILENVQVLDTRVSVHSTTMPSILHTLIGDQCNEKSWLPIREEIRSDTRKEYAPVGGRPSNGTFPFWNLQRAAVSDQTKSEGIFIALGWSGQWKTTFHRTSAAGNDSVQVTAGMEKIRTVLYPNETIRSPRILLMPWSCDRPSAHALFRRLLLYEYIPKMTNGLPQQMRFIGQCFDRYYRKRNGWEKIDGQFAYAEKLAEVGCDTHWFDAAWFPKGFPTGVGNWFYDPTSFPDGLRPLADKIHALGMKFILWFEPERVADDTWLSKSYPQYVFGGERGGLYKLNDPEARTFLTNHLSNLIESYGVDVYRSDFNIDPLPFWRANDTEDRQGITEIRYVEGHYAMWNALRRRHPGLWIDNCASGGRRIDLETIHISIPLWRSDTCCWSGHPQWDQTQTLGLAQYLPLYAVCAWEPDPYVARSAAHAGTILQYNFLDDDYDLELAKASIQEAKVHQKFWYGDFYALSEAVIGTNQCTAWQLHRSDLNAGLVYVFRQEDCIYTGVELPLRAIDSKANYRVVFRYSYNDEQTQTMTGTELQQFHVPLPKRRSSVVVRYLLLSD